MQRRLIATIIGVVVGAILLCGLVTFGLAGHAARSRTRGDLVKQATDVAAAIKSEIGQGRPAANILRIIRTPFRDENDVVLIVGPNGRLIDITQPAKAAALPSGLRAADLHPDQLLAGQVVSGIRGATVYAAAPYQSPLTANRPAPVTQVVVLTRQPTSGLREAAPWFLLSSLLVLLVAVVVGDRLGRRISGPLRAAEEVTRRIAAGDLNAQIPPLDHTYPELESLTRSVNSMTESLARSRGLERQFLMSVSHDLRTPLTSIRGFAEAIADGAAPDNIRAAGVIASEARRLERLVGDLLDLAKLDARRFSLDLRRIDVAEVVGDTVDGFGPAAAELGLELLADLGPAGPGGHQQGPAGPGGQQHGPGRPGRPATGPGRPPAERRTGRQRRPRPPGTGRRQPGRERPQVRRRPGPGRGVDRRRPGADLGRRRRPRHRVRRSAKGLRTAVHVLPLSGPPGGLGTGARHRRRTGHRHGRHGPGRIADHRHRRHPGRRRTAWLDGGRMTVTVRPWGEYVAWSVVGVAWAVSLVGALTIGIFVAPIAAVATFVAAKLTHNGRGCSDSPPASESRFSMSPG